MLACRDDRTTSLPYRGLMRLLGIFCLAGLVGSPAALPAQFASDVRTGLSRAAVELTRANHAPADTSTAPRKHPTARRIGSGIGFGIGVGLAGLFSNICLHEEPCSWDILYTGIAGYWLGGVIGTSIVRAPRCSFPNRFGRALIGSLPGAAIAYGVARASYRSRDVEAFAATTVVALSPIVSSTLVLRTCE